MLEITGSSDKKTVFCVFVPNANANQTIEPKHIKIELNPCHKNQ